MPTTAKWGLADLLAVCSIALLVWTGFSVGFRPKSDPAVVLFGTVSCLFWFLASTLPMYWDRLRDDARMVNGLNSVAAAATGVAVISSESHAWTILKTSFFSLFAA